jgi:glycosyltransferase involved in cell wall biosynthesis
VTRILVLTNMYPPHHLGGYELSCRDTVQRWRAAGHEVTVLTTTMRLPDVTDPPGERATGVRRDLTFSWRDHQMIRPPLRTRLEMERGNQRALTEALTDARPDVVSAWHMGGMSLGLLTTVVERGVPLVLVVCDDWLYYAPHVDAWMRLFRGRKPLARIVRRATGLPTTLPDLSDASVCYVSDFVRRRAERVAGGWVPPRATVVYSGIDPTDFPTVHTAVEKPWSWRLLSVGRIDERKGIHVAIEALAHLPAEATLAIIGRGDATYEARLRSLATSHGVGERVEFAAVDRPALRDRYAGADACVFPTLWEEPFGLVPVEAMACRTPVVATGTGGSGEFLRDGVNCLLVPPGDAQALAAALRRLAAEPSLRARLADGGVRTADELSIDRLADFLEAWHVAAAMRFSTGAPLDRPSVLA